MATCCPGNGVLYSEPRQLTMDFPTKSPSDGCQKHWAAWCQLQEKC